MNDEEERRLRVTVSDEIQAVMDRHQVGGVVLLSSPIASSWRIVFPKWSGLQYDPQSGEMRLRLNSREPGAQEKANATVGHIACLRDMASDCANIFGRVYRTAKAALEQQGCVVEHTPFAGGHGIDPASRKGN